MPPKKAPGKSARKSLGLLDRLAAGPVICAEGYLFEFERRGYLQAIPSSSKVSTAISCARAPTSSKPSPTTLTGPS